MGLQQGGSPGQGQGLRLQRVAVTEDMGKETR